MRRRTLTTIVLLGAACLSACSDAVTVAEGEGHVWLTSSMDGDVDKSTTTDRKEVVIVEGDVTEARDLRQEAPSRAWYGGGESSRVVTVRTPDGVTWTLGYRVKDGRGEDVSPDLAALVGRRVRLLFRAVRAFGSAPAFVLSDDGPLFAMDLAVYGDPLKPGDLPSIEVARGRTLGVTSMHDGCFASRHYTQIFRGDTSLELAPGESGLFTASGRTFRGVALFHFQAEGEVRCTDVAGGGHGWAIWRE